MLVSTYLTLLLNTPYITVKIQQGYIYGQIMVTYEAREKSAPRS